MDGNEKYKKSKRKDRRKIADYQSLLKEDFYSDPQLATTLQGTWNTQDTAPGLEDDMYSINGDMATLSPYPLLPKIPSSQPVAKIYLEKQGRFSKPSVANVPVVPTLSSAQRNRRPTRSKDSEWH